MRPDFSKHENDADADGSQGDRRKIGRVQQARQHLQLGNQFTGLFRGQRNPEQILELAGEVMTAIPTVNPTVTG